MTLGIPDPVFFYLVGVLFGFIVSIYYEWRGGENIDLEKLGAISLLVFPWPIILGIFFTNFIVSLIIEGLGYYLYKLKQKRKRKMVSNKEVRYWTGVGSREVPSKIADLQVQIGERMAEKGYHLRSGNANGSDYNFQLGVSKVDAELATVYLPWKSFNKEKRIKGMKYVTPSKEAIKNAGNLLVKSGVISFFFKVKESFQLLHGRNVYQVTGQDGTLPNVCIYYAPLDDYGQVAGGTRTAVWLSRFYKVDTFNLYLEEERREVCKRLCISYDE